MRHARWLRSLAIGVAVGVGAGCQGQPESNPETGTGSRITRLDITSRRPAFGGATFGDVGTYEILAGTVTAVADPADPRNEGIIDLDLVPRNDDGVVEYRFDIHILKPTDLARGSGVLVYEINNRGRRIVYRYFNAGSTGYDSGDAGSGFLMNRGHTYISSGWMHGSASGADGPDALLWAELPVATDNGEPITGLSMEEWMDPASPSFGRLTYPAATLDPDHATLTFRQRQDDPRVTLDPSAWSFVDESTVSVTPPPNADAGTIYEFVYEARDPIVNGLGFAAIRDAVSFLRHDAADDEGQANPLFIDGRAVLDHAIGIGSSQSGRMVRDFLYQGFNQDPAGRQVFDGMNAYVAGARRTFVNARFALTGRWTRQHEDHNYPMDEFPFTYGTTTDPLTGRTDGLLARCSASNTCPKVVQVDTDSEWYGAHGSLVVTDPTGQDVALPSNVRYWMLTTAHLQRDEGCRDPANPIEPFPYYRAAFDATVKWVVDGVEPPESRAPSVADGSAVSPEAQGEGYPTIPDRPFSPLISTLGVRDFSEWPPTESDEQYPLFVPRLDEDGNAAAGVIIPEGVVPIATMSKAVRGPGFAEGELCSANGAWLPFPKTAAERRASGDSRLSMEERYSGGLAQYAEEYAQAVDALVAGRFLLPEDGEAAKAAVSLGTAPGLAAAGLR